MVRVISNSGQRLMPCSPGTARKLLKGNKAEVVGQNPFVIRLKNGSSGYKQSSKTPISRTGNKTICKLRTSQVFKLARKYYKTSAKRDLVRKVYREGRNDGIEYMAKLMGLEPEHIYRIGNIEEFKKRRTFARRGRKYRDQREIINNDDEIKMLANELAGGGAINITGGKRTVHKCGSGNVRNASNEQAWQARIGN